MDEAQERRVVRAEFATRAFVLLLVVLTFACLAVLLSLTVYVKARAQENGRVNDRVFDCTSPTGQCYQQGQARTADAVRNINRVVILAAACSTGLELPGLSIDKRQTVIQLCVLEQLDKP